MLIKKPFNHPQVFHIATDSDGAKSVAGELFRIDGFPDDWFTVHLNGNSWVVSELATGMAVISQGSGMGGDLHRAISSATNKLNKHKDEWFDLKSKCKKILQENGLTYPLNEIMNENTEAL